jgi:hypothetical protein
MKIRVSTRTTGGITPDVTGAETFATIVSLAESPVRRGLLFAGTDDGNVWTSPDDGRTWNDLTARFAGKVPDGTYVSRIEPSSRDANRFYVTFDNHRRGDFTPYVLATDDGGQTFRSIASNLPAGGPDFVHVVREDPVNPDLLYVGTDVGVYISLDRGGRWQKFMTNLPTVPVHDLKIHPRDRELVAATHGRSFWIVDVAPLQQMNASVLAENAHLFEPAPAHHWGTPPTGGEFTAQLYFEAENPGPGAEIRYWLGAAQQGPVRIAILNARGDTVQTVNGSGNRGLNRATWNLRGNAQPLPLSPSERRDSLATERRLKQVVDSLVKAGTAKDEVDRAVSQLRSGGQAAGFGGGRGGGGGQPAQPGRFVERPAEGPAGRGGGPGGAGGPGAAGGPGGGQNLAQQILQRVRPAAGGRGGRGGFGGGTALFPRRTAGPAPLAAAGEHTVSLTVGGRTITQKLVVRSTPTAPSR